eukprot:COSAG01_NODE_423_length_17260_cov_203.736962_12_plen_111_part_00
MADPGFQELLADEDREDYVDEMAEEGEWDEDAASRLKQALRNLLEPADAGPAEQAEAGEEPVDEVGQLRQELAGKDQQLQAKDQQLQANKQQLQAKDQQLQQQEQVRSCV